MKTWLWRQIQLYFIDHGILRTLYANLYELPGKLYRSNQPSPRQLEKYQRDYQIRTVFNVRGHNEENPVWQLERDTCAKLGLKLISLRLLSRSFPYVEDVLAVKEAVLSATYPALAHCKSGADRAGLFSALYRIFRLNEPVEIAKKELGFKFGHFSFGRTGVLDQFFDEFIKYNEQLSTPITFENWLRTVYDRDALKKTRNEHGLISRIMNFILDRILRRE